MGGSTRLRFVSTLAAVSVWPAAASAQTQGQLPTREEVTPPVPTARPPAATASVDTRGALAQSSCPFEDSPIRLTLKAVTFTRPDGGVLQVPIARALAGIDSPAGEQPIRVICDLRDRANEALRRDGWVASVQVPAQSIAAGELKLQVVTARITEIRVRGTPGPYRRTLEARLGELRRLDPLNERDAERALLLAGDAPGLDVQLSLRPAGTQPGDVIGDLSISYRPFALVANAQNFNSRALGRETVYARGEAYGLLGLQDVTYLGASTTTDFNEQRIVQAGATFGLGLNGLSFGPRIVYAWSRPDLGALKLRTNTLIAGFDAVLPVYRSLNRNFRVGGGFDLIDQRTRVDTSVGRVPLSTDKLRVVYARLSGDLTGRRGDGSVFYSFRAGVEVRKGLGILGASPVGRAAGGTLPSRTDGDSRAGVARLDADATVALNRIFSISGSARGQFTRKALLNYEEFSLGNLTIGRGYDPGANTGDRAIGVRGEVAARVPLRSRLVAPQAFGFYDSVWLTNLDRGSTEVNRHLRSFGGGLRLIVADQLQLEGIYAHPQDKALLIDRGRPSDRFLLSLTARFDARQR